MQLRVWKLIPFPTGDSSLNPAPDAVDGRDRDVDFETVTSVTEMVDTDSANLTNYVTSPLTEESEGAEDEARPATPRVRTPRPGRAGTRSPCDTDTSINYSIFSVTRPPSFLFKFRKTVEVSKVVNGIYNIYAIIFLFV